MASTAIKNDVTSKGGLECIQLGQKYNVGQWIKRGIHLLIKQRSPLNRKVLEGGGLSLNTICGICIARDRAVVEVVVQVYSSSIYSNRENATYLRRDESGMQKAAEEIFASEYAAYGGMGKETLHL